MLQLTRTWHVVPTRVFQRLNEPQDTLAGGMPATPRSSHLSNSPARAPCSAERKTSNLCRGLFKATATAGASSLSPDNEASRLHKCETKFPLIEPNFSASPPCTSGLLLLPPSCGAAELSQPDLILPSQKYAGCSHPGNLGKCLQNVLDSTASG